MTPIGCKLAKFTRAAFKGSKGAETAHGFRHTMAPHLAVDNRYGEMVALPEDKLRFFRPESTCAVLVTLTRCLYPGRKAGLLAGLFPLATVRREEECASAASRSTTQQRAQD